MSKFITLEGLVAFKEKVKSLFIRKDEATAVDSVPVDLVDVAEVDETPKEDSDKLITSGGAYDTARAVLEAMKASSMISDYSITYKPITGKIQITITR